MHVVVAGGEDWGAAVTIPQSKVRVSFAIPWEGMLLLGTTDTLHEGEPDDAAVTEDDVRTILDEATSAIDGIGPVRASFLGLRVLPGGPGATANARRETVYTRGSTGMLSVAGGGKLTTYRRIALDALEQLGVRNLDRAPRPLPGAIGLANIEWPVDLDAPTHRHWSTSTARGRPMSSGRRSTTRRCSSRSWPGAPICGRRTRGRGRMSLP